VPSNRAGVHRPSTFAIILAIALAAGTIVGAWRWTSHSIVLPWTLTVEEQCRFALPGFEDYCRSHAQPVQHGLTIYLPRLDDLAAGLGAAGLVYVVLAGLVLSRRVLR
jgi:hypothetical protein